LNPACSAAIGYIGHEVHVVRRREARWLLDALGDVQGKTIVDVAGGDGYWAARLSRRGARTVAIDLAESKLHRGRTLRRPPGLVKGDALRLPFPDGGVDGVLSICAIEHFADGEAAIAEMARVTRTEGLLAISADALSKEHRWPGLSRAHRDRYAVVDTYDRAKLTELLVASGFEVLRTEHMFKQTWAQNFYLRLHRWKYAPNAFAPLGPIFAGSDARSPADEGAIVLLQARRR
jgi:ubiquinone/menaquinone biosynthesis C-methylase UbiE